MRTEIPETQSHHPSKRDFLKSVLAVHLFAASVSDTLAQVPWKLNSLPTNKLIDLLDEIELVMWKRIPQGTNNPVERYFAVIPDNASLWVGNMKIYSWISIENKVTWEKKVTLYEDGWKRVFIWAESVRGSWVGERIRLGNDWFIITSIGVPVKSESLPEEERSKFPYTFITSTPPNRAFQTPEIQDRWLSFLRKEIRSDFTGRIAWEDMNSSFQNQPIEKVIDERLVLFFAIVEHMDVTTMKGASDPSFLEAEYKRVLTNYWLNRNLAYRYGKSTGWARGMMQITPSVFKAFDEKYEDVDFGEDHTDCVSDPEKSILLATLKLDEDIWTLIHTKWTGFTLEDYKDWRKKPTLNMVLALAIWYNAWLGKYIQHMLPVSKIEENIKKFPPETQVYLAKIRFVFEKLFWRANDAARPTQQPTIQPRESRRMQPKRIPEWIYSTLKWWRTRLHFEKDRARTVATRARNYLDIWSQIQSRKLQRVSATDHLEIDHQIWKEWHATPKEKELLHYLTPVAHSNLLKIAELFHDAFWKKLRVTSLNRCESYVRELAKTNKNATTPSSHEYGTTFDVSHKDMTPQQKQFMEQLLMNWQKHFAIIAIKERKNACYHVFSEKRV